MRNILEKTKKKKKKEKGKWAQQDFGGEREV